MINKNRQPGRFGAVCMLQVGFGALAVCIRRISLASAALLGGCNLAPVYERPATEVPAVFKENSAASTKALKPAEPKDEISKGKWWQIYKDDGLNELEERVTVSNKSVLQSYARVTQARALVREARAQYFPALSISAFRTNSRSARNFVGGTGSSGAGGPQGSGITANRTNYNLGADLSWEPDLWGRIRNTVTAAAAEAEATAADFESTKLAVQTELAISYFQLRTLDAQQDFLEQTVKSYEETLHLVERRFKNGVASAEDIQLAKAQLQSAKVQAADAYLGRQQVEHAIAVLLGEPPAVFSISKSRFISVTPEIPAAVPSGLLERRPDIAAAERRVAEANARIGIAKAAYFPVVTLGAQGGFQSFEFSRWLDWPNRFYLAGPSVSQLLFDGGARAAEVERIEAALAEEIEYYRETILTAFREVEDNLIAVRILELEEKDQQIGVAAAQEAYRLSVSRYRNGVVAYYDVLTAQNSMLSSKVSELTIRQRKITASANLIRALGGGWRGQD